MLPAKELLEYVTIVSTDLFIQCLCTRVRERERKRERERELVILRGRKLWHSRRMSFTRSGNECKINKV